MATPRPKRRRPWLTPDDRRIAADVLPRPNFPAPFIPNVLAPADRTPIAREPDFWEKQRRIQAALPNAVFQGLQQPFKELQSARTPDEFIHALTGVGLSMDPNSPAARPSDARGGRGAQALAVALNALPGLEAVDGIANAEHEVGKGLRNAREYSLRRSAFGDFPKSAIADHVPTLADNAHLFALGAGPAERASMNAIDRALTESVGTNKVPLGMMLGENPIASLADEYRRTRGLTHEPLPRVTTPDPAAHRALAQYYENTPSMHNDPSVRASYRALMRTIDDQAEFLKAKGYRMGVVDNPTIQSIYETPQQMHADVLRNRNLDVNRTTLEQANLPPGVAPVVPGQAHPILTNDENDRFRWVHDILGHTSTESDFSLAGEEQAYRNHAATMPPEALPALASETRGQTATYFHGSQPGTFVQQKALAFPEHLLGDYPTMQRRETLTGPALRLGGKVYSDEFPRAHVHVLGQAQDDMYDRALPGSQRSKRYYDALQAATPNDEGFIARDEAGNTRFVTRKEAAQIYGKPISRFERTRRGPDELHAFDVEPNVAQPDRAIDRPTPAIISPLGRYKKLIEALLPDEQAVLTKRTIPTMEAAGETLPDEEIFGAGALAGKEKMGWYANSARALSETFGPDSPRFAALLAALSPQRPVSDNLRGALDLWDVWNHTGRTQDPKLIRSMMNDVARAHEGGGELEARVPNAIRALTAEDPASLALSGPKVFNFHRNLMGDAQRVTLDTWMRKLAGLPDNTLARTMRGFGQPSPTYLAYAGRVRQTADYLHRLTGHPWTPAEVQETLWSWGKALGETADASGQPYAEAIPGITSDKIRGAPDFATLMNEAPFYGKIRDMGLTPPIASTPLPPAGLPGADPLGLDILAGNLQKIRNLNRRMGQRGALGGPRTILRVENDRGIGPYQTPGPFDRSNFPYSADQMYRQPLINAREWDRIAAGPDSKNFLFGFRDASQLKKWFTPEELDALSSQGYRVQPYQVPSHIYDRTQAVFDRRLANRAPATPLTPQADPMIPGSGNAALPMLGLSGGAALGGLTLWDLLKNR